ncbi:MAG: MHYT domain-containing protein, partial [Cyanobacteria bacterium P01_D01_bin.73]
LGRSQPSTLELGLGGLCLGSGIGLMHYLGMAAVKLDATISYDSTLVALSVAIAIVVSCVALGVFSKVRGSKSLTSLSQRFGVSVLLGGAIPIMHYVGMAATRFSLFSSNASSALNSATSGITSLALANSTTQITWSVIVTLTTVGLLGLSLVSSLLDKRLSEERERSAALQESRQQLQASLEAQLELTKVAEERYQQLQAALQELKDTQSQMIQGEKMASLGRLVAGVAHEMNNPVGFVHGNLKYVEDYTNSLIEFAEFCRDRHAESDAEISAQWDDNDIDFLMGDLPKMLSSMRNGTQRIESIVKSLESFSGLNKSGEKRVSIQDIIEPVLVLLEGRLQRGIVSIDVEKNVAETAQLPLINCYPKDLSQVFLGILDNAADAIEREARSPESSHFDQRSPKIELSVAPLEDGQNSYILVVVTNNGPPIPLEIQEKIFDPFFTTKGVGEGTGIGLSVAYQTIVYQHHGDLWCESDGDRTSFYIQLPLDCEEQSDKPSMELAGEVSGEVGGEVSKIEALTAG